MCKFLRGAAWSDEIVFSEKKKKTMNYETWKMKILRLNV